MTRTLIRNCRVFDGTSHVLKSNTDVLVEGNRIAAVESVPDVPENCVVLDGRGATLMPGLIDAHVHVYSPFIDERKCADLPPTLMAIHAARRLRSMLDRGFTTVRDVAGGDFGIKQALEEGLIPGPRLFISGRALSTTGGHGDNRKLTASLEASYSDSGNGLSMVTRVADGVSEVQKAVRDELRKGADHIKLLVSGGVGSPYDPLESVQYTEDEITAAVQEAHAWGKYVCAHSYTAQSTERAVRCGVRCIEHGNLIDSETATLMAEQGAYIDPTLVCYEESALRGAELGLTAVILEKLKRVNEAGISMLGICHDAGVKIGLGTDLMGELIDAQSREFSIRAQVLRNGDILRSATSVNAEILQKMGELGVVVPGALADLIVVDGNPLEDISLLEDPESRLLLIMKDGSIYKSRLVRPDEGVA